MKPNLFHCPVDGVLSVFTLRGRILMMRASRMYQKISKMGNTVGFPAPEIKMSHVFLDHNQLVNHGARPKNHAPSLAKVQNPHPVQRNPMTAFTQEVTQAGRNMPKLGTMMACVNPQQQKSTCARRVNQSGITTMASRRNQVFK